LHDGLDVLQGVVAPHADNAKAQFDKMCTTPTISDIIGMLSAV
jgi:hypothetical protein